MAQECSIEGTLEGDVFRFRYQEPEVGGEGWFKLHRFGKFAGQWLEDGQTRWQTWQGQRGFDGIWQSTFGPLRLVQEADKVRGFYEGLGSSSLEGQMTGNRLVFRYQEPRANGEGWFELAEDGLVFEGQWRPEGSASWCAGRDEKRCRYLGSPGSSCWKLTGSVALGEKEFAFGNCFVSSLPAFRTSKSGSVSSTTRPAW